MSSVILKHEAEVFISISSTSPKGSDLALSTYEC